MSSDRGRRAVLAFVFGLFCCSHHVCFVRCDQAKNDGEASYRFANVTRSDTSVEILMLCPEQVIDKTEDVKIVSSSRKCRINENEGILNRTFVISFQMSLSYDESPKVAIVKNIESGSYLVSFKEDVNK